MRHRSAALFAVLISLSSIGHTADPEPSAAPPSLSAAALAELVAPIALYPDDLLGIVLPASTYPLQIVQAARFLEALKNDPKLQPDPNWDDSIVALLNYPEVVALLDGDIDWTWRLGEAVINQNDDVIAAVADFRERAVVAGNLRSDDRQIVARNEGAIEIRPANPQVIYVPYYEPSRVVVYQPTPVYYYYPRPYPVYYYPYPVGYHFYSPYFWGVTSIYSIAWGYHDVHVCHVHHHHHRYNGHHYHHGHYYYRHPYRHYDGGYAYWGRSYDRNRYGDDDVWRPDRRHGGARPGDRHRDADRDRRWDGDQDPGRLGGRERRWTADRGDAGDVRPRGREDVRPRGREDVRPRQSDRDGDSRLADTSRPRDSSDRRRSDARAGPTGPGHAAGQGYASGQGSRNPSAEGRTERRWRGTNVASRMDRVGTPAPRGVEGLASNARAPANRPTAHRTASLPAPNRAVHRQPPRPPAVTPAGSPNHRAPARQVQRPVLAAQTPGPRTPATRPQAPARQSSSPAWQSYTHSSGPRAAPPRDPPAAVPREARDPPSGAGRGSSMNSRSEHSPRHGGSRSHGEGRRGGRSAQR